MSATVADFLAQMRGLLDAGVKELPAKSNNAPPVTDEFFKDKWCAMTVSYCLRRVGFDWFRTARVVDIKAWAEAGSHGMRWLPPDQGQPGDLLIWMGDRGRHVNVVETRRDDGRYVHIGGNEQDAVRRSTWSNPAAGFSLVGVARLPFAAPTSDPPRGAPGGLPPHVLGSRTLRVEDPVLRGTDVATWQQLTGAGLDGRYGEKSAEKTREFQKTAGVAVDGKVGPATLGAMRRALAFASAMAGGRG
jgi:hypothetical protein